MKSAWKYLPKPSMEQAGCTSGSKVPKSQSKKENNRDQLTQFIKPRFTKGHSMGEQDFW